MHYRARRFARRFVQFFSRDIPTTRARKACALGQVGQVGQLATEGRPTFWNAKDVIPQNLPGDCRYLAPGALPRRN
jgi:hypothetical protein